VSGLAKLIGVSRRTALLAGKRPFAWNGDEGLRAANCADKGDPGRFRTGIRRRTL